MKTPFPLGATVRLADLDDDPYPILRELREQEPVSWVPEIGMWFVTRREDVVSVLNDPATFTTDHERSLIKDIFGTQMLTTDGPEQLRYKKQCIPPFTRATLRDSVGPALGGRISSLIDGFADDGAAELRTRLANPLSVGAMLGMLGLPDDEAPRITAWYEEFAGALANFRGDPDIREGGRRAAAEFGELARDRLSGLAPDDDSLLGTLVCAADRLSDEEIIANALIILFGGIETTEAMISNAVWCLLSHPDELRAVREDRGLIGAVIAESLRWEPAVQSCTRHATRDTRLRGVPIAEGQAVQCMLGAANRDPEQFDDPDRFDIHRSDAGGHLSFGAGRHFCLGAPLAELETELALAALLDRFGDLALDPDRPSRPRGYEFRKPPTLWVRW